MKTKELATDESVESKAKPQDAIASLKEREVTALELTAIRGRNVLPAEQAAWYAGIARWTLLSLARDQQIPHHKRGKLIYFKTDDLDRWMMGAI